MDDTEKLRILHGENRRYTKILEYMEQSRHQLRLVNHTLAREVADIKRFITTLRGLIDSEIAVLARETTSTSDTEQSSD